MFWLLYYIYYNTYHTYPSFIKGEVSIFQILWKKGSSNFFHKKRRVVRLGGLFKKGVITYFHTNHFQSYFLWVFIWYTCVRFVYTISISILCVSQKELSLYWIYSTDMWLPQVNNFWKAKTLWNFVKWIFDISKLFIRYNTYRCCEHITGGVNIYLYG